MAMSFVNPGEITDPPRVYEIPFEINFKNHTVKGRARGNEFPINTSFEVILDLGVFLGQQPFEIEAKDNGDSYVWSAYPNMAILNKAAYDIGLVIEKYFSTL